MYLNLCFNQLPYDLEIGYSRDKTLILYENIEYFKIK